MMRLLEVTVLAVIFYSTSSVSSISIKDNAYKGITVSLTKSVHEEGFKKLKEVLTRSSELLYHATRRRSYFGEFVLSLPRAYSNGEGCEAMTSESPSKVDVQTDDRTEGGVVTAKHSRGCGEEGDVISMPVHWLKGETEDLARQFVKQWSIYRYGVFEEDPIQTGSCYMIENNWSPVGCYNVKVNAEATLEKGVPVCFLPTNFFDNKELKSSLMSQSNSSQSLNFCDDSDIYPHNPSLPTLHNNLCNGENVWSVIEESKDFKYGRNTALVSNTPPSKPVFKCFKEPTLQVTFAIQNSTTFDLSTEMVEIGYSLFRFLKHIAPSNTKTNIVMFSDSNDNSGSVDLDLTDPIALEAAITKHVKTYDVVTNTCVLCGFQKALNATLESPHPSPTVILIAWESSLLVEKPSKLTEMVKNYSPKVRLHLILVEDTVADVLSPPLVDAVRTTGGNIYSLPKEHVLMATKLQIILAGVVRNHLQAEDSILVVHESTYNNVKENFLDSFSIPSNIAIEKVVYNMYCDGGLSIHEKNPNCSFEKTASAVFKCGQVLNLKDNTVSPEILKYPFEYTGGTKLPNCSSVAMLSVSPSSKRTSTLKGWLSKYQIDNGRDGLVIYAEVVGTCEQRCAVQATVSGSALLSPVTIQLLDNGNGDPDVKSGDGIYSRYFTSFNKSGTYVVSISAEVLNSDGKSTTTEEGPSAVPRLIQKKIIGSFIVSEDAPEVDILPPNRIADLRVHSIDHENGTVILQWTAPGDDYDYGAATSYEIKYSKYPASLSQRYFNSGENVPLQPTSPHIPSNGGTLEEFQFKLPEDSSGSLYYVALRAVDANNNIGRVSNIIQVYLNMSATEYHSTSTASLGSTLSTSTPENGNYTKDDANTTAQTPTENITESTTGTLVTDPPSENEFFDEKTIIVIASAGGILLLIIIINIIVCCCCIKTKKQQHPETSKKTSPYNLNISFQDDSNISNQIENESSGVAMSTLERNLYTDPSTRMNQQRYTYHTDKSLQNRGNSSQASSDLGFKLVQTFPQYATPSLSRFKRKLNNFDSETESDLETPTVPHQSRSDRDDTHLYSLGVV